jgi:hypothetical protein
MRDEPERMRKSYDVQAHRLEPVGHGLSLAGIGVSAMAIEVKRDPDLEWLDHVRPSGSSWHRSC